MKPAEVLNRAADYIEEHGWTHTAEIGIKDGRVCAAQAIQRVAPHNSDASRAVALLSQRLRESGVDLGVTLWNDEQRSRVPVLKMLRGEA